MGVTSKGFRYPEGTVIGNTIHTKIKELADDLDSNIVVRDTRLNGLDSKTDATNALLNARGLPISRPGSYTAALTNVPNDDVVRTIHQALNVAVVPAGARTAMVTMAVAAHCVANAQVHWQPAVNFGGGWVGLYGSVSFIAVHNQGNAAMNMGFDVTSVFDVRSYVGSQTSVAVNAHNDSGSAAWVHAGYMNWTITFQS